MDPYAWPDWIGQNGYIQFTAVLPPISTGDSHPVGAVWDAANCRVVDPDA